MNLVNLANQDSKEPKENKEKFLEVEYLVIKEILEMKDQLVYQVCNHCFFLTESNSQCITPMKLNIWCGGPFLNLAKYS